MQGVSTYMQSTYSGDCLKDVQTLMQDDLCHAIENFRRGAAFGRMGIVQLCPSELTPEISIPDVDGSGQWCETKRLASGECISLKVTLVWRCI